MTNTPLAETTIADTALPRLRRDLQRLEFGTESAIYDPGRGCVHVLNETASRIAAHCDGQTTALSLANLLVDEYATLELARALADIASTVSEFEGKHLVE